MKGNDCLTMEKHEIVRPFYVKSGVGLKKLQNNRRKDEKELFFETLLAVNQRDNGFVGESTL